MDVSDEKLLKATGKAVSYVFSNFLNSKCDTHTGHTRTKPKKKGAARSARESEREIGAVRERVRRRGWTQGVFSIFKTHLVQVAPGRIIQINH